MRTILAVLGKIGILGLILCAFAFGLAGTVYLSLRSPSVSVPDVTSKTFSEGETALEAAGLSIRERARRYKSDVRPGIILDQFPRVGEVVKQGQTVAVIVSRAAREGEAPQSDEMVEGEEEKAESSSAAVLNENRPRRRTNRNTNTNASNAAGANSSAQNASNAGAGGAEANNSNRGPNQNNSNRNSNAGRNQNSNDNRGRPNANNRNQNSGAGRNQNSGRGPNNNRRPN